jgi:hypothetical protein
MGYLDYGQHITVEDLRKSLIREKQVKNNLRAETLRESLDPEAILTQLFEVVIMTKTCDKDEVAALSLRTNILLAILKKCLPDLKQVEVKGLNTKNSTLTIDLTRSSLVPSDWEEENKEGDNCNV